MAEMARRCLRVNDREMPKVDGEEILTSKWGKLVGYGKDGEKILTDKYDEIAKDGKR